uniref:Uncharacterized protein n=1 Tax=Chromera velia CCMP2878 TaxID=1169474 RepID=A0A0G4HDK4_9ALVE|eukprot:Cvel_26408.t1-p1 / transcript=Cvel_26408.t1 / gene=Cvel_26408 / organism=Chromera_velia_CCMP2878 / gene_product=hypothetical protein / transcript_product=hypothetical protein / location=Cvel_scaffold3134:3761-9530(-) / protein_length=102 / sequence_SO=supercontig / SO=protein_coding / is_pseudo=false
MLRLGDHEGFALELGIYLQREALSGYCKCSIWQLPPELGKGVLRRPFHYETMDEIEKEGRYFCQICHRTRDASPAPLPDLNPQAKKHVAMRFVFRPRPDTEG